MDLAAVAYAVEAPRLTVRTLGAHCRGHGSHRHLQRPTYWSAYPGLSLRLVGMGTPRTSRTVGRSVLTTQDRSQQVIVECLTMPHAMKLGVIEVESPDGREARLVAVKPEAGVVIDLRAAERIRLQRAGATASAARRLAAGAFPPSMTDAIAVGPEFIARAQSACDVDEPRLRIEEVSWLPAVDPPLVRDCMAFEQHLINAGKRFGQQVNPLHYQLPAYYKGSRTGLIGHQKEVRWPGYTAVMDYELELGFVIGVGGTNLQPEDSSSHLFGVTIFNDFSARDIQGREMQLVLGPAKGKDFATAVGPWITTLDELDLGGLEMIARVNGQEWSRGNSATMMWTPSELVAYLSYGEYLQPGDLIGSGTVGGGCGFELGRQLSPGDVVELEVSGIGVLRNQLGQPEKAGWNPTQRKPTAGSLAVTLQPPR
jgi:2-keto-4-pentenoate hydratase/2-oxohepta-3-ene-1,7-dioic acid hydratase in catechol pathway